MTGKCFTDRHFWQTPSYYNLFIIFNRFDYILQWRPRFLNFSAARSEVHLVGNWNSRHEQRHNGYYGIVEYWTKQQSIFYNLEVRKNYCLSKTRKHELGLENRKEKYINTLIYDFHMQFFSWKFVIFPVDARLSSLVPCFKKLVTGANHGTLT